ncbi:nicotinate phosphoribosyltransferase, partial [Vibrio parahaemolyticus]|nr:nicotinate phosphoribosyltransferase [Vibrio parahaemolyticus]
GRYLHADRDRRHLTPFNCAERSTRRRVSFPAPRTMWEYLSKELPQCLTGTRNYHLARELDLTPMGTGAHAWFMGHQALVNVR